ncbi:U-box domain-containing protein 38 [Forsythia ovata]|uniref:RING-type E3 ubiquitin transferase n=1 Tax=Forsythia ovata TaxID=205694 RepID=A0ABD1TSW1_9LAMI
MGGNDKIRWWKISLHKSSKSETKKSPPQEFLCPIFNSLMLDPVVVSSGQTFERLSVQVCRDLGFTPKLPDGSEPDFSSVIPNLAIRSTILNWCKKSGSELPKPPEYSEIESIVSSMMAADSSSSIEENQRFRVSERELLKGVAENPQVLFSRAATELNPHSFYSCSSEESVIANGSPLLPFTTKPSCISYSSSPSTSSEFISDVVSDSIPISYSSEDENFVSKMTSLDAFDQEQAVILLRKTTRSSEEARIALCTERLLFALRQLLNSRYAAVQINAAAALVNLSLAKLNKIKIVRAGIIPLLIEILKNGFEESREHAAGAIFSLALEDENKTAIGVLGALQPLLHVLRSGSQRSRHDAALALYHLTLMQSNRVKIIKLGAVGVLVRMLKDAEVADRVVLGVCNLAACPEGQSALLDANAVECLVGMLRNWNKLDSESTRENCIAALYSLSHGSLRFKGLARKAKAAEVLLEVVDRGSERAREKGQRILEVLRGRDEEEEGDDEVDWEAVMQGRLSRARHRVGGNNGPNSTEF